MDNAEWLLEQLGCLISLAGVLRSPRVGDLPSSHSQRQALHLWTLCLAPKAKFLATLPPAPGS